MRTLDDTICALATPPGTGGLGVIRISGPDAFAVTDQVTRRPKNISCAIYQGHTLHRAEVIDAESKVIDDVLLAIFHAPRSYTGEDVVEISGHGGPVSLRQILQRLLGSGARLAQPGEFTQRAFLNGKMDLAQAEAVGDVIAAQTEEALHLARQQQAGHLSRMVTQIRDRVLGVLARIEASIDFPEEVGELDTEVCEAEIGQALAEVANLLATADQGILYREGVRVVLAGRPNVGKSSLMNALLRHNRAIVTPIPGTTRDVIEETLNLHGIPVRLVDTAGLRETEDIVEKIGVERSQESLSTADIAVLVLDATVGITPEDDLLRCSLTNQPHLIVWNKWDLMTSAMDMSMDAASIALSAATGWNLGRFEEMLASLILGGHAKSSQAETAVVTHARHRAALNAAQASLLAAQMTLADAMPADFVAIDLRGALTALGEITGETATEDIISEIFSRFCIGK